MIFIWMSNKVKEKGCFIWKAAFCKQAPSFNLCIYFCIAELLYYVKAKNKKEVDKADFLY